MFLRFLIVFFLASSISYSQDFNGLYKLDSVEYLEIFNDSNAIINIYSGGCLPSLCKAFGIVSIQNSELYIKTQDSDLVTSSYYETVSDSETDGIIEFIAYDLYTNEIIPGVNLVHINDKQKFINGTISGYDFNAFDYQDDSGQIKVSYIGYDSFTMPLSKIKNKRIKIFMTPYNVLTENLLKFEILNQDSLLFESWGYPVDKRRNRKLRRSRFLSDIRMVFTRFPWKYRWFYKGSCNGCSNEEKIFIKN